MSLQKHIAALAGCCLISSAVFSQETKLSQKIESLIPEDALGYVVVQRIADTDERVQAIGKKLKQPVPSIISLVKQQGGIAEGIDVNGSLAISCLPTADGPSAILFVPVSNFEQFVEQLNPEDASSEIVEAELVGRDVVVTKKQNYALITWSSNRDLLEKVRAYQGNGQIGSEPTKTFDAKHDISAVITTNGVKTLSILGKQGLQQAKTLVEQRLGEDNPAVAGLDIYIQLLDLVGTEVSAAAGAINLDDAGSIRVEEWVWLQPDGKLAPMVRELKAQDTDLLDGLPNIPYVMAMGGSFPEGGFEAMMEMSGNMMKAMPQLYGLTPDQVDAMLELSVDFFQDMQGMSFILGVGQPGGPLYDEMMGVIHVNDADEYMDKYRQYWKELKEKLGDDNESFLANVEVSDVEIEGKPALKLKMPIPGLQGIDVPNPPEIEALMEKFYGPDGVTMFIAPAGKTKVLMAYTDVKLLQKTLQTMDDPNADLSANTKVIATSKLLPKNGKVAGYWNPKGTCEFANRMVSLMSGDANNRPVPPFPQSPPVGFVLTTDQSVVKLDWVVPEETVQAIGEFVDAIKKHETEEAF